MYLSGIIIYGVLPPTLTIMITDCTHTCLHLNSFHLTSKHSICHKSLFVLKLAPQPVGRYTKGTLCKPPCVKLIWCYFHSIAGRMRLSEFCFHNTYMIQALIHQ